MNVYTKRKLELDDKHPLIKKSKTDMLMERFYIGTTQYSIKYTSEDEYIKYLTHIFGNVEGWLSQIHAKSYKMVFESAKNASMAIALIFYTILKYNGISINPDIDIGLNGGYVGLTEPVMFSYNSTTRKVTLYFSESILRSILNEPVNTQTKLVLDTKLKNNQNRSLGKIINGNFKCNYISGADSSNDEAFYRLIVIADHCATHFIELYYNQESDLVTHTGFGTTPNTYTIGSMFDLYIKLEDPNNDKKICCNEIFNNLS